MDETRSDGPLPIRQTRDASLPTPPDDAIVETWTAEGERSHRFEALWGALTPEPVDLHYAIGPEPLGDFEIIRELGRGGMGVVYLARDCLLDRHVALKVLRNGLFSERDMLREARAAARIRHPNIAEVYAVVRSPRGLLLAMEYVSGTTLNRALAAGLTPERRVRVSQQLLEAVAAAHERGIVHGDLKPSNVLVDEEGAVRLVDWGLARRAREHDPEVRGGTPGFMPPEQEAGRELDARSDVFGLGVLLAQIWVGKPIRAGSRVLREQDRLEEALAEAGSPGALAPHLLRAVRGERPERFSDAGDMARALAPIFAVAAQPTEEAPRPRRGLLWLIVAMAATAGVGLGLHGFIRGGDEAERAALFTASPTPNDAVRADPPHPLQSRGAARDEALRRAIGDLYARRFEEADAALSALVTAHPEDSDAHYYRTLGRAFGHARRIGEPFVPPPDGARPRHLARRAVVEAAERFEAGTPGRSVPTLRRMTEHYPGDWELWYALGECLFHSDRRREAHDAFARAHDLAPAMQLGRGHLLTLSLLHAPKRAAARVPAFEAAGMDTRTLRMELGLRRHGRIPSGIGPPEHRAQAVLAAMDAVLSDDLVRAEKILRRVTPDERGELDVAASSLAALGWLDGDRDAWSRWMRAAAARRRNDRPGYRVLRGIEASMSASMAGEPRLALETLEEVEAEGERVSDSARFCLASLLASRASGDSEMPAGRCMSHSTVGEMARALAAMDAGDADAAVAHARAAFDAMGDAVLVYPLAWLALEIPEQTLRTRACGYFLRPPFPRPTWAYGLPACRG